MHQIEQRYNRSKFQQRFGNQSDENEPYERIREWVQCLGDRGGGGGGEGHVHGWHRMTSGARYHRVMTCFVSERFKASTGRGGMRPATAGGAAPAIPPGGSGAGNDD